MFPAPRLGAEALANPDFDAGGDGWTVTNADATHIATFADGSLRYQSGTTSPQLLVQQANVVTTGGRYQMEVDVVAWTSGSAYVGWVGSDRLTLNRAGLFRAIVTAGSVFLNISRVTANVDLTIGRISMRPVL